MDYIQPIKLYDLFFTKPISHVQSKHQIIIKPVAKSFVTVANVEKSQTLTPMSKMIYKQARPELREKILHQLIHDDIAINEEEIKQYMNDSDYQEKMENNRIGFFMEDYISVYGKCPVCGENSLRKYVMSNIPVVDLICINKNSPHHTNQLNQSKQCFLFQVKTGFSGRYFNKNQGYITVGSKKFGYNSHIVNAHDSYDKKRLVIGYICIELDQLTTTQFKINKTKSFILIPNIQNKYNISQDYYKYNGTFINKNIINWNKQVVDMYSIAKSFDRFDVDTDETFTDTFIINPYINLPYAVFKNEWTKYISQKNKPKHRLKLVF